MRRQLANAVERIKMLELDVEPDGRISEAFSILEDHMDSKFDQMDSRFDRIETRLDRMEVMLEFITGLGNYQKTKQNKSLSS